MKRGLLNWPLSLKEGVDFNPAVGLTTTSAKNPGGGGNGFVADDPSDTACGYSLHGTSRNRRMSGRRVT